MLFNSLIFLFAFLPLTWFFYYIFLKTKQVTLGMVWLVFCSLFFYGWGNPVYVGLIILSMVFNFLCGKFLSSLTRGRKPILIFGIGANLILLGYYKYFNFFISILNTTAQTHFNLKYIILPLAISFFTFTQIAFLVDSYKHETREYNFLHYCLFVTFFPHLIAGPIVHHKQLAPQFAQQVSIDPKDIAIGLSIFIIGLFKKIMLADSLMINVGLVYGFTGSSIPHTPDFFAAWIGTISYTLQLYFDFSGYSDMAIGLSLLFGIKLPINFNSPYKALNIIDFWRRWHMTLSQFLRDYLYIPLGGNRKGKTRRYINLWLTMLLGGIWHGASINFLIWGFLHGFYLVINNIWQSFSRTFNPRITRWIPTKILSCGITFIAVMIAWVFFRAHDLHSVKVLLESMIGLNGFDFSILHNDQKAPIRWIAFLLFIIWFTPNTQQIFNQYSPALGIEMVTKTKQRLFSLSPKMGFVMGFILFISLLSLFVSPPSEFMYFTF